MAPSYSLGIIVVLNTPGSLETRVITLADYNLDSRDHICFAHIPSLNNCSLSTHPMPDA